jgi:excisionase family DNA binding protein
LTRRPYSEQIASMRDNDPSEPVPQRAPILLTVDEAARTLLCSRATVYRLLASGVLVRGAGYGKRTAILAESVFAAAEKAFDPTPARAPRRRVRKGAATEAAVLEMWR